MSIGRIESASTKGDSTIFVAWDDGRRAEIDLRPYISTRKALAPLAEPAEFRRIHVAEDRWSVEWPTCGVDLGAAQLRRWADEQSGEALSADAFRAWMERQDLTLDRAAEVLGLSRRTIAYYLSGEQPIPKTVMLAIEGYERQSHRTPARAGNRAERSSKQAFSWLHLSDLHVGMDEQDYLWPRFQHLLKNDLETLFQRYGGWDAVLFSGDLVQAGTAAEYKRLNRLIDQLWSWFEQLGSAPILITTPGNHDLVRPAENTPEAVAFRSYWSSPELQRALWTEGDPYYHPFLDKCFHNYLAWRDELIASGRHAQPVSSGILPGDALYEVTSTTTKVAVVSLNSAWLQLGPGDFKGQLAVHPKQLIGAVGGMPDDQLSSYDLAILMTHHPSDWLHPSARQSWHQEINATGRFDLHAFGHMHEARTTRVGVGGSMLRTSLQAASLFGLERHSDEIIRIQGYASHKLVNQERKRAILSWPRKLENLTSDDWALAPDTRQGLNEDNYFEVSLTERRIATSLTATALEEPTGLPTQRAAIDLMPLRYHVSASRAHILVRTLEQKDCVEAIVNDRMVWISADWGMGEDPFLASVLSALDSQETPIYRFDFEDYTSRADFLDRVKEAYGFSFQRLCDAISDAGPSYFLFDEIPLGEEMGFGLQPREVDVEALAQIVIEYAPAARVVLRTRKRPIRATKRSVHLRALDEADTAIYLRTRPDGERFNKPSIVQALHRHTDGVPSRLDAALRYLEVGSLEDLTNADIDIGGQMLPAVAAPQALVLSVAELQKSSESDVKRAHDLLLALSTLPKGEQLARLKRFYGPVPIHAIHATVLHERGLIDSLALTGMGRVEDASMARVLVAPRPVREHIRQSTPPQSLQSLDRKALELYFGEDWRSGDIDNAPITKRTKEPLCNAHEIANASTLIVRALHQAADRADDLEIEASLRLGASYVAALLAGDHFRSAAALCEDLLPSVDPDRYKAPHNIISLARAKALRMIGETDAARDQYLALDIASFPKAQRQDALLGLALCYRSLDDPRLQDTCEKVISLNRHSSFALQAQSLLAETIPDKNARRQELLRLLGIARKKKATIVKNNILMTLSSTDLAETLEDAEMRLREVAATAKAEADYYNSARAIIEIASKHDHNNPFPVEDRERLIQAYHFLYNERLGNIFDRCHKALWDLFEAQLDTNNLFNLFRHSSFIWRIYGKDDQEQRYLKRLRGSVHNFITSGLDRLNRDQLYFFVRVTIVLGDPDIEGHSNG